MPQIKRTKLIQIGNSKGLRIPKLLLEQLDWPDSIELEVHGKQLVIRPIASPRIAWAEQFQAMAAVGDDALLDIDVGLTDWEESEWEWT